MVPREFLVPYLAANVVAIGALIVAFRRPGLARWAGAAVFLWASITNTRVALTTPAAYLDYGALTPSALYRDFIGGWFAAHIQPLVLAIAAGQLVIAVCLAGPRAWRRVGVAGAVVFLAAIAPLGVGSGFPFSLTFGAALVVMHRRLGAVEDVGALEDVGNAGAMGDVGRQGDVGRAGAPAAVGLLEDGGGLEVFVPAPDVRERHETTVRAPADIVFDTAEHVDFSTLPVVRAIFALRSWAMRAGPGERVPHGGLVEMTRAIGWGELRREPGRLLVMGAVTQPWKADVVFRAVPADVFRAFAEPDLVKIAWTLEAAPLAGGRTRLATETRVVATDEAARRKFRRYWRIAGFGIVAIRLLVLPAIRRTAERRARAAQRAAHA
ncbi:MAG: hypothetical protein R2752_16700 [Vicinamibacterales bacterium]